MSTLEPFQQRAVEERAALNKKANKLSQFMSEPSVELPDAERKRLGRQLDAMCGYLDVLDERIEAFNV